MKCGFCGMYVRPSRIRSHVASELRECLSDGSLSLDGRPSHISDPWHMMDHPIVVPAMLLERAAEALDAPPRKRARKAGKR